MNIPGNAKKIFTGIIRDIYQREQKLFDGSLGTFEIASRKPTAQIIVLNTENKILVCRNIQPGKDSSKVDFFGGRGEHEEGLIDIAKRELLEESGYVSDERIELEIYDAGGSSKINWQYGRFLAKNAKKIQEPMIDPGEQSECLEYKKEDFMQNFEKILTDQYSIQKYTELKNKIESLI